MRLYRYGSLNNNFLELICQILFQCRLKKYEIFIVIIVTILSKIVLTSDIGTKKRAGKDFSFNFDQYQTHSMSSNKTKLIFLITF